MDCQPLVSILIASYNHEKFIGEAIDSCLNQTYSPIEVVVVDDGSTDKSREIIASYGKKIIPIYKENEGGISTRNVGFPVCKGEYICLLDSDDYFYTEKVAELVKVVSSHIEIGWYFHRIKAMDNETGELIRTTPGKLTGYCDIRKDIRRGMMPIYGPATSGLSFSREVFQQMLPFPVKTKYGVSDKYLRAVAASLSPGYFEDKPLGILRVHSDNMYTTFSVESLLPRLARLFIRNAYWLQKKWPEIIRYSNRVFGHGIGVFRRIGGIDKEYQKLVNEYLTTSSYQDQLEILVYSIYYQYIWNPQKSVKT